MPEKNKIKFFPRQTLKLKNLGYNKYMDQLDLKIEALEKKIDKLQRSIDKLNRIFIWTLIITIVLFVLPLFGLLFAIPKFLSVYSSILP